MSQLPELALRTTTHSKVAHAGMIDLVGTGPREDDVA